VEGEFGVYPAVLFRGRELRVISKLELTNTMWLFWIWGLAATSLMVMAQGPALFGWGDIGGDNAIVGFFAALAGIPEWLILFALTVTRWRIQSHMKSAVQNAPALVAAVLFIAIELRFPT
jgi:hypothetical protein